MKRRNFIEPIYYYEAETGNIVSTVLMRTFQIEIKSDVWETVRQYEASKEAIVNPGFGKPPQNEKAFSGTQERY